MPTETATTINQLDATKPAGSEPLAEADDHLRLLKSTIKATFPNVTGATTVTHTALSALTAPAGARAVAVGSIHSFPKAPTTLGVGGVTSGGPFEYLECDGTTTWLIATYPELGAFLGTTFGGNGTTTFGVPNYKDTGRFLRSRTASVAVGTYQSNTVGPHTHTGTASVTGTTDTTSTDHYHTQQGTFTSGGANSNLDHTHNYGTPPGGGFSGGGGGLSAGGASATTAGVNASIDHTHNVTISGATAYQSATGFANYQHTHTFTSSSGSIATTTQTPTSTTETRPEAGVVIMAIRT